VSPCLKCRGLFIAGKRLDNYYLLQLFLYPQRDLYDHQVKIHGRRFVEVSWILPLCSGLFWSLLGPLLLFPRPSMPVGAQVCLRLLNAVLFLVVTSSFVEQHAWVG
jgi:hypothetical protein